MCVYCVLYLTEKQTAFRKRYTTFHVKKNNSHDLSRHWKTCLVKTLLNYLRVFRQFSNHLFLSSQQKQCSLLDCLTTYALFILGLFKKNLVFKYIKIWLVIWLIMHTTIMKVLYYFWLCLSRCPSVRLFVHPIRIPQSSWTFIFSLDFLYIINRTKKKQHRSVTHHCKVLF